MTDQGSTTSALFSNKTAFDVELTAGLFFSVTLMVAGLEDFRVYLGKCFDFEQVTVKKFRTWAERRQFNRDMKRKQAESERPILPANQKLITLSVQDTPTKKGTMPGGVLTIHLVF